MTTATTPAGAKPPLSLPVCHLNGSGKKNLMDAREAIWDALETAADRLRAGAPNGRDYYPDGPAAMEAALEQHRWRLAVLREIQADLETEMAHVQEAGR